MTRTLHGFDAPYLARLLDNLARWTLDRSTPVTDEGIRGQAYEARSVAARLRETPPVQPKPLYQGDGPCTCAFCQEARSRPHDL